MSCDLRSSIKLLPNIVDSKRRDRIGIYVPIDLLPRGVRDVRVTPFLTDEQRKQIQKMLFWAETVVDTKERFFDSEDAYAECADCVYRDICY